MSHSKRNTTRPVFTSYERALAKSNWTESSARLNRDSYLPFGSCGLCLEISREPVACPRGDIFCRECVLANLLAQKKELKRAERARQDAEVERDRIRALEDDEERERAVRDFEMTQAGLSSERRGGAAVAEETGEGREARAGSKRKFAVDEDELKRIVMEDKAKARKAIEDEKSSKPSLPSFWTPSLTPSAQDSKLPPATRSVKKKPMCPASATDSPHALSLQRLMDVRFEEDSEDKEDAGRGSKKRICPSCRKTLSNSSTPIMAEACGHVLCLSCVKQFLLPSAAKQEGADGRSLRCLVCDVPAAIKSSSRNADADGPEPLPVGFVKLRSEGTGFSARGSSTVEKSGVVFQC